jgi:hypothetical protein
MNKECIYDVCHRGPCKKPTVAESDFCEEHLGKICKENIRTEVVEDWNKVLSHNDILQILNQHFSGFARNIKIENMSFNTNRNQLSIHLEGKETSSINNNCENQAVGDCHGYHSSFVCGKPLCVECKKIHKH